MGRKMTMMNTSTDEKPLASINSEETNTKTCVEDREHSDSNSFLRERIQIKKDYGSVVRATSSSFRDVPSNVSLVKGDDATFKTSNNESAPTTTNKVPKKKWSFLSSSSLLRSKLFWASVIITKLLAVIPFVLHRRLSTGTPNTMTQEMIQFQTSYWESQSNNQCNTQKCFNDKLKHAHLLSLKAISNLNSILEYDNNDEVYDFDDDDELTTSEDVEEETISSSTGDLLQQQQPQRGRLLASSSSSHSKKDMTQSYVMAATDGLNNDDSVSESVATKDKTKKTKKHRKKTFKRPPSGCEVTVQIIRHCEKDILKDHCDYIGFERAQYLTTLYGNTTESRHNHEYKWPIPSELYALDSRRFTTKKHKATHLKKMNMREIETLLPLAIKYDLTINDKYGMGSEEELAQHIFKELHSSSHEKDQCGRLIVICWHHTKIATLAHMLGCGPTQGCPLNWNGFMEFDNVWEIKYVYDVASHHLPSGHAIPLKPQIVLNDDDDDDDDNVPHVPDDTVNQYQKWKVFGTVVKEQFDPLAYSTQFGDYTYEGTTSGGGRWISDDMLSTEKRFLYLEQRRKAE